MSKKERRSVPVLRFKGFTDDWEQRKLGDIANSFEYGLNVAAKKFDGKNKYIRITDIDDSTHAFLKDNLTSPNSNLDKIKNYQLKDGDILFTRTGASVGKTYIYEQNDGTVFYAGFLIRANICTNYDPEFIFQNTLTERYDNYIQIISQRSGQPGVNAKEYAEYTLMCPSLLEQKRISSILKRVDELIILQQRKMDNLSKIQKSLENNLFPDINHVRKLKASKNNWHTKKLNNIFNERKKCDQYGQLLSVSMTKGVYPFNPSERKDNSSSNKSNYKVVRKGDIAYNSMRMWQGACGVSKYDGIVSPAYTVITPGSNEDASFYYYYFKNNRMKFEFRRHSQGLTSDTWNLKFPLFKDITIEVPNNEKEQIRIRKLLDTLNEAIKHGNGRIRKLKLLKSFLLQKMFI